jgi:hypothetical protein
LSWRETEKDMDGGGDLTNRLTIRSRSWSRSRRARRGASSSIGPSAWQQ